MITYTWTKYFNFADINFVVCLFDALRVRLMTMNIRAILTICAPVFEATSLKNLKKKAHATEIL